MKKLPVVLLIIVALLVGVAVLKDQILKSVITATASGITGAPVSIDKFSLGIIKQSVRIEGFKMGNPQGFPSGTLIDLPKIEVAWDLPAFFKGTIHLRLVDVNLKEIGLTKNKDGKLNVDSLKVVQEQQKASKGKKAEEKKPAKALALQIDLLNMQMGRLVMKDYSAGAQPSVQAYDINIKKSYKNITSPQQLAALILSEPMKQAGIKGAGIYGVALLTGVGFVPVVAVVALTGKDSVQKEVNVAFDQTYGVSLDVLKQMGKVSKEDKTQGLINAEVNGASVTLKLKQVSAKATQITVSARKYMLPKQEIANGVLYQISEKIK
jgi:uncharacterized protein involved in outer membrane biogenesis